MLQPTLTVNFFLVEQIYLKASTAYVPKHFVRSSHFDTKICEKKV